MLAAGVALSMQGAALAQQQQPAPPEPSPPPQAMPEQQPGMFESIGRFFDQGAANFRQSIQGAKQKFDEMGDNAAQTRKTIGDRATDVSKGAADVGKGAVDALVKLPTARVIDGRENCALAANGAPDCQTAAQMLCRKKGFATGKSMDFTSAEQCPARVWLSGRQSGEGCTTVTFISRAMCQ